jgi:hypothetical protein
MLKQRVLATLRFFALQDIPLTLFELHKYLLNDMEAIKQHLNAQWEVASETQSALPVAAGDVLACLETECKKEVKVHQGFYFLAEFDQKFVSTRLQNYMYGIFREQIIKRFTPLLRYLPFLRSIGLVGSQALGLARATSDIDVLIIVEPKFLGLARFFVTVYFQILGVRRHGKKVANRFCLNHYLVGPKTLQQDRNIYTASEYLKARPIYHGGVLTEFKENNWPWLQLFFPNAELFDYELMPVPPLKAMLEKLFANPLGKALEAALLKYQQQRLDRSEFVVAQTDELSFHPDNRKAQLFAAFFEHQQEN